MDEKSFREHVREEWEKLTGLTWGERLVYIWDYYKPLMVAVLVVIGVICLGVSIWNNLQIHRVINVYLTDSNSMRVDQDAMAAEFGEFIGGLGPKDEVLFDTGLTLDAEDVSNYGMASMMKAAAVTAAGDVDVMLFNEDGYGRYRDSGGLMDLREILSQEQLERWSGLLIYAEPVSEESQTETEEKEETGTAAPQAAETEADMQEQTKAEHAGVDAEEQAQNAQSGSDAQWIPVALDLTEAPILKKYDVYPEGNVYGSVFTSGDHIEMAPVFFEFLLQDSGS